LLVDGDLTNAWSPTVADVTTKYPAGSTDEWAVVYYVGEWTNDNPDYVYQLRDWTRREIQTPMPDESASALVTQTAHWFVQLDWLTQDPTTGVWSKALADAPENLWGWHVVQVIDADTVRIARDGIYKIANALTRGHYILSNTVAWGYTQTDPTTGYVLYGMQVIDAEYINLFSSDAVAVASWSGTIGTVQATIIPYAWTLPAAWVTAWDLALDTTTDSVTHYWDGAARVALVAWTTVITDTTLPATTWRVDWDLFLDTTCDQVTHYFNGTAWVERKYHPIGYQRNFLFS